MTYAVRLVEQTVPRIDTHATHEAFSDTLEGSPRERTHDRWQGLIVLEARPSGKPPTREENPEPAAAPPPALPELLRIPATSRTRYLSGYFSLSLRHPSIGMGSSWRHDPYGHSGTEAQGSWHEALRDAATDATRAFGDAGLVDFRLALATVHHPAAGRSSPVWGAVHVRAALELAWGSFLRTTTSRDGHAIHDTYDRKTMKRWLTGTERAWARALGARLLDHTRRSQEDAKFWIEWLDLLK